MKFWNFLTLQWLECVHSTVSEFDWRFLLSRVKQKTDAAKHAINNIKKATIRTPLRFIMAIIINKLKTNFSSRNADSAWILYSIMSSIPGYELNLKNAQLPPKVNKRSPTTNRQFRQKKKTICRKNSTIESCRWGDFIINTRESKERGLKTSKICDQQKAEGREKIKERIAET